MNKILVDVPVKIETSRLILTVPKAGMGQGLFNAIQDGYDEYNKWLNLRNHDQPELTAISVEKECRQHHADFILREYIRYIILDKLTKEILGYTSFPAWQSNWTIPQFEIDYFIRKTARGKGCATEATHVMTLVGFEFLKARKIEIYCDSENQASCRVPEKLNFEWECTQRGGWPRQDQSLAELRTYVMFDQKDLPTMDHLKFSF